MAELHPHAGQHLDQRTGRSPVVHGQHTVLVGQGVAPSFRMCGNAELVEVHGVGPVCFPQVVGDRSLVLDATCEACGPIE